MTEQKMDGQYVVVEKPRGTVVWKGSAESFNRKPRDVLMRRGIVYASLENPDGKVVKRIPLNVATYNPNAPRPPKQLGFKI